MKTSAMLESKYLKGDDLNGEEVTVTVEAIKKVNLARDDEEPKYRWTVKFTELPKAMVLNATNIKRMEKYVGDDTDDWPGRKVVVYYDENVTFGAETVGGLRIKGVKAPLKAGKPTTDEDVPFN